MTSALRLDREMAPRRVRDSHLVERRVLSLTQIPRVGAAVAKAASVGPVRRCGNGSRNHVESLELASDVRHREHESLGVRMVRLREELVDARFLHYLARVHHDHARGGLGDYA